MASFAATFSGLLKRMTQRTSGWRLPLSFPGIYGFCQNLLGGPQPWRKLVETYIRPENGLHILDLGCGPAAILEYLPESVDYVGVDVSREYIDAARKKYGKRSTFHCMSIESLSNADLRGFDLVMGLGVLHHLGDKEAHNFFAAAAGALNMNGRCLTVEPCLVRGQHPIARLLIRMDRGQNVRASHEYAALAMSFFPNVIQHISHDWLRVPYTHHMMECRF
jgi:cyclopropane fatty-acyl-phospholipid synthase-like methyltransferase